MNSSSIALCWLVVYLTVLLIPLVCRSRCLDQSNEKLIDHGQRLVEAVSDLPWGKFTVPFNM